MGFSPIVGALTGAGATASSTCVWVTGADGAGAAAGDEEAAVEGLEEDAGAVLA